MKNDNKVIAALLTVAFYTGRGSSMGLPQVMSTYNEIRGMLDAEEKPAARTKKRRNRE